MAALTREPPAANVGMLTTPPYRRPFSRRIVVFAVALTIVVVAAFASFLRPKPAPVIATEVLVRKTLVSVVTATGTVNPKQTISVGTQVSGTIQTIVADYNDAVHKGQVLARIDPTLLQASLDQARAVEGQARAQWQAAQANYTGATSTKAAAFANADADTENARVVAAAMTSADATVVRSRAALKLTAQTLQRDRALLAPGFIAQNQFDTDYSNQVAANTALSSALVAARQARMQVSSARSTATAGFAAGSAAASQATGFARTAAANLAAIDAAAAVVTTATINLKNTVITSPVDGTVIARNVSIGQTVAASFQTPTLYTIAQDLTAMEVDLAAGEPDIGTIHVGQPVDFTVLAYPNHIFHEKVAQVRYNPTTVQNVVTYDTVLYENNTDQLLRPGMTVEASIQTARVANALVVSRNALDYHASSASGTATNLVASPWGDTGANQVAPLLPGGRSTVTVIDGKNMRSIPVRILLVDGGEAAIEPIGQALEAGDRIAVSSAPNAASTVTQQSSSTLRAPSLRQ